MSTAEAERSARYRAVMAEAEALAAEPCDRPWPCLHACCVDLLGLPYPTKCSPWCSADVAANIPCLHRMRLDGPEETR